MQHIQFVYSIPVHLINFYLPIKKDQINVFVILVNIGILMQKNFKFQSFTLSLQPIFL